MRRAANSLYARWCATIQDAGLPPRMRTKVGVCSSSSSSSSLFLSLSLYGCEGSEGWRQGRR